MALKTIGTFYNVVEAQIIKSKLESSGIKCFLFDDNMSAAYSNVTGGTRVQVLEEDAQNAKDILDIEIKHEEPAMSKTSTVFVVAIMLLLITLLVLSYGGLNLGSYILPSEVIFGCVIDNL